MPFAAYALKAATIASMLATALADCNGVDYPNGDFPGAPFQLPTGGDATLCQSMCSADPQCYMSIFIPPLCEKDIVPPTCYLKASQQPASPRSCRCSAAPVRPSPPTPTAPLPVYQLQSASTGMAVSLGPSAMTAISLVLSNGVNISYTVEVDSWSLALGNGFGLLNSTLLPAPTVTAPAGGHALVYTYGVQNGNSSAPRSLQINVTYELQDGWSFVRKTLTLSPSGSWPAGEPLIMGSVSPWDTVRLVPAAGAGNEGAMPTAVLYPNGDMGQYGAFIRWSDGSGMLAAAGNPFLYPLVQPVPSLFTPQATGALLHVGYHPAQSYSWYSALPGFSPGIQPFTCDPGVLSIYPMPDLPGPIPPFTTPMAGKAGQQEEGIPARLLHAQALPLQAPALVHRYGVGMSYAYAPLTGQAGQVGVEDTWVDAAERDAFRSMIAAHAVLPPSSSVRIHIPWTENDYEVDISTGQWAQYPRVLDMVHRIGVGNILVAASDYSISNRANNTDSWGWEQVLFLGNGQHIREGYFYPSGQASLPPTTQTLLAAAQQAQVAPLPYVYPILGFRNATYESSWLYSVGNGLYQSRLDDQTFQDWFVELMGQWSGSTGSSIHGGAGYDYTFYQDTLASTYSQWAGWRRILTLTRIQALTAAGPGGTYTVDNRQLSHSWSPWMWAAGSYAEPFQTDEGPYSWPAYVKDPLTNRQSGNRQRQMSYDYSQAKLCPSIHMPGFIGHQSDRFTPNGDLPVVNTSLNIRDYDYYGLTYNLLSSLSTGPLNHVVCGLPARDAGEYAAFPAAVPTDIRANSVEFYSRWFDWSDVHRATLLYVKPLPVAPAAGVVDGTYATAGTNTGFLFLFNPNTRQMATGEGLLAADARLGIACNPATDVLLLSELWPVPASSFQSVSCGDAFQVIVEGRGALVLNFTIVQGAALTEQSQLRLFGSALRPHTSITASTHEGSVDLHITGLADLTRAGCGPEDEAGWDCDASCPHAYLQMPSDKTLRSVSIGAQKATARVQLALATAVLPASCPARAQGPPAALPGYSTYTVHVGSTLAASPTPSFPHSAPVQGMEYNATFTGGQLTGTVRVPSAVFQQLASRNSTYPVPWTSEDLPIPWLLPGRLIAYIDASDTLGPGLTIPAALNGQAVQVQPVWSCRSLQRSDCFSGYWLDLTAAGVQPDMSYALSITLPTLPAGAWQGVYYDNIDAVYSQA